MPQRQANGWLPIGMLRACALVVLACALALLTGTRIALAATSTLELAEGQQVEDAEDEHDLANASWELVRREYVYTGQPVVPQIAQVTDPAGRMLTLGKDYELSYLRTVYLDLGPDLEAVQHIPLDGAPIEPGAYSVCIVPAKDSVYTGESWRWFTVSDAVVFIDSTEKTSHFDDILWLAESGISTGWDTPAGKEFRPNANVKRGDMAAFLFRLAKQWKVLGASDDWAPKDATKAKFTDVGEGTSHARAIWWMAENGISAGWEVPGSDKAEFRPNADVKRGDLAAFLGRLADKAGRKGSAKVDRKAFLDVSSSTSHAEEIWWMAASGVSGGWDVKGGKEFRPNSPVKRGDMAAFLHRLDGVG